MSIKLGNVNYEKAFEEDNEQVYIVEYISEGTIDNWKTLLSQTIFKIDKNIPLRDLVTNVAQNATVVPMSQPAVTIIKDDEEGEKYFMSMQLVNPNNPGAIEVTYQMWSRNEEGYPTNNQFAYKLNLDMGMEVMDTYMRENFNDEWLENDLFPLLETLKIDK